jgi:hypothetical protein
MSNKVKLRPGQSLPTGEKLDILFQIRETIERGYITTTAIAEEYGVTMVTASAWRKQALKLLEKDTNGYTREGIRNIQIGRINYMIETLTKDLKATSDPQEKAKLHDRIVKYYDSLHRITGLNSEVNVHQHQQLKPLQVVMPHTTPVEGEVAAAPTPSTTHTSNNKD